jgi:copper resistance protein B
LSGRRFAWALAVCSAAAPAAAQAMPGHGGMAGATPASQEAIAAPAPPPKADDWAADRYFDPQAMARARRSLRVEHGGAIWSMGLANLAEWRSGRDGGGYHWDAEASTGGDINRFVVRSEGEGASRGKLERGEVQALVSHAIGPYYNLQAGLRRDVVAHGRTYATVGIEGVAPYFIETNAALFLSDRGDLLARGEAYTDLRLTQRLILQPRVEVNLASRDMPRLGVGAGVSDAEAGLRLRYEVSRLFAPYVGVAWSRSFGAGGRARRADGERAEQTSFVAGVRAGL